MSLQEQKDAIARYAQRNSLEIAAWFEEQETAAKRGRAVFNQMLKDLKRGKAQGILIHKIDRSARNLKDWSDLGELIDQGIEVHFVNESLDMHSRGGRLSADIQAVVAADYIRNLREETRKGFYGRLKQGLYPLPAPVGYLDKGKGKPKELDPMQGPLVRKAFELYASGKYNLASLGQELYELGLRNARGSKVTRTGLSTILNNPFYFGLIRLRRTNEVFSGTHPPLIRKSLFDRVQYVLKGKFNTRVQKHDFLFRRVLTCKHCGYSLIGETRKGHVYYRCHSKECPTTGVRQEAVEQEVMSKILRLQLNDEEKVYVEEKVREFRHDWGRDEKEIIKALDLRHAQIQSHLDRLTDAYIERLIEKELFERRKIKLIGELKEVEEKLAVVKESSASVPDRLAEFLGLVESAYLQYEFGLPEQKRDLVKIITSDRQVEGKKVDFTLSFPFSEVANRFKNTNGVPYRDIPRTWAHLLPQLTKHFAQNPAPQIASADDSASEYSSE